MRNTLIEKLKENKIMINRENPCGSTHTHTHTHYLLVNDYSVVCNAINLKLNRVFKGSTALIPVFGIAA